MGIGNWTHNLSAANALLYPWGFMAQETFISINVENSHALHQFKHTCIYVNQHIIMIPKGSCRTASQE